MATSFAVLRRWTGSLRFRLTLWNTVVVLVLMLVCLFAIREGLRVALLRMLNEFVEEELNAAATDVEVLRRNPDLLHQELDRRAWAHPRRQLVLELFDESGRFLWGTTHASEPSLSLDSRKDIPRPVDIGDYRVMQQRLTFADGAFVLRVAGAKFVAERQLDQLTSVLLLIGGVIFLFIPLGGYLLAGRATHPLAQMIETTARLHPSQLDERLPLRGARDELDQLAQTINGFLDRIASFLKQNRDFTANVAHELRTPLSAMQFSLELALNADRSVEEYKEFLFGQIEECGNLCMLVNRLLILAEADAGKARVPREPVRLDEVVLRSLDMFQVVAENAGLAVKAHHLQPVVIQGDGPRLGRVINNLLDNAIKFTPAGGTITVKLSFREATREGLLTVADTGTGVAPGDLPHIFERFYQGDKSRHRQDGKRGSGLGLAIVETIVLAHDGAIQVESTPGKGATFTITFPGCVLERDAQPV